MTFPGHKDETAQGRRSTYLESELLKFHPSTERLELFFLKKNYPAKIEDRRTTQSSENKQQNENSSEKCIYPRLLQ